MGAHLAGPWRIDAHTGTSIYSAAASDDSAKVCDIRGWGFLTGRGQGALGLSSDEAIAIQDATARLIAAAPELLDTLENLVIGIGMGWDLDGLIEAARAAIAKANPDATPAAPSVAEVEHG